MSQMLSRSSAVFVVPSRPLAAQQRRRLVCIYKVSCYSFVILILLILTLQLPSLRSPVKLFWFPGLYLWFMTSVITSIIGYFFYKAKKAIDEYRAQQKLVHSTLSYPQRLAMNGVLDCLLPWWIKPLEVTVYLPSQIDVHDALQEQKGMEQASPTAIAEHTVVEAAASIVRIGVSLLGAMTLTLVGDNGKKVMLTFRTQHGGLSRYTALIAYLALVGNGAYISRTNILQTLYQSMADKASSFDRDRLRIQKEINTYARSNGLIPLELFENDKTLSNQAAWRLSPLCVVEDGASLVLDHWYHTVMEAQEYHVDMPIEALREGYQKVIEACSRGFLTKHMQEHDIWNWAHPLFFEYRNKYLTVLEYAAQQEYKESQKNLGRQNECLTQSALLYEKCALIAVEGIANSERGKRNLEKCLAIYEHSFNDKKSAKKVKNAYEKRFTRSTSQSQA